MYLLQLYVNYCRHELDHIYAMAIDYSKAILILDTYSMTACNQM